MCIYMCLYIHLHVHNKYLNIHAQLINNIVNISYNSISIKCRYLVALKRAVCVVVRNYYGQLTAFLGRLFWKQPFWAMFSSRP